MKYRCPVCGKKFDGEAPLEHGDIIVDLLHGKNRTETCKGKPELVSE